MPVNPPSPEASQVITSELVASLSHALRTPLNGIIGFSSFLASERPGPLNPAQKEFLGDVQKSTGDLQRLLNDLTDLAKLEAGQLKLSPVVFPLWTAVAEVESSLRSLAGAKAVQIRIVGEEEDGQVHLDPMAVKRVLTQLFSAAVELCSPPGVMALTIRSLGAAEVSLRLSLSPAAVDAEGTPILLREFRAAGLHHSREYPALQLGLVLAQKLIERQGGRLEAAPEDGRGLVFNIILPRNLRSP